MENTEQDNYLLEHSVINQLEADFQSKDFESMSEMLQLLIKDEKSKKILFEYLSDSAKENLIEGRTSVRY